MPAQGTRHAGSRTQRTAGSPGRLALGVLGLVLVCVGLPAASASTLGPLDPADLVASRSTARPAQAVPGTGQVAVAVTRSDHTSYCADVTVSTTSTAPIRWQAAVTPAAISSNPVYRLDAVPSAVTGARTVSFATAPGRSPATAATT